MKKLIFISALIFINISLNAQSHYIGIKYIGAPQSDDFSEIGYMYDYKQNNGYTGIGISYDFYSKSNFTIGLEATFNNFRNYSYIFDGNDNNLKDYKRQFHFVSTPLKIGYKVNIGKKIFLQPSIGLIPSYLTNTGTIINYRYFDSVKAYKRFDILGLTDLMIGYNLTDNIALTGSYRYQFKLNEKENIKNYNGPISTNRSNFTVGLSFKLAKKR